MSETETNHLAQDALNRMQRAHKRRTGCHLSADMIEALSVTFLGQIWSEPDPRNEDETDPQP